MDILVILALVVGFVLCFLPSAMAWSHYADTAKHTPERERSAAGYRLRSAHSVSK